MTDKLLTAGQIGFLTGSTLAMICGVISDSIPISLIGLWCLALYINDQAIERWGKSK